MSGGSYNYAFRGVEEMAESLESQRSTPERLAFAALLRRVARAMRDIEWVDSCDMGDGKEVAAIMACIDQAALQETVLARLSEAIREAEAIMRRADA